MSLQYAFPLAAISGLLLAHHLADGRFGIDTLDLIHFGDFELTLGVLSVLSINWFGKDKWPLRLLKVLGLVAGVLASIGAGSRGGWLAIPVFIMLIAYFRMGKISLKLVASSLGVGALLLVLLYASNTSIQQRVDNLNRDMAEYSEGRRDTSAGIRWQLYLAAVDVFLRHPIFGVGPEGFAAEMKPMAEAGKLTVMAADLGKGEVHNDILSKAAGMGIFGLLAILAVYFIPLRLFWRAAHSSNESIKRGGLMGVTFVSGFVVYGLTVEFLNLTLATAFYSFTIAVLLAFCYNIHHVPLTTTPQSK
jgi:O-antigen ligase